MLDRSCPNAREHRDGYHQTDRPTFLALLRQQLAEDLDMYRNLASLSGACGVLCRVRLSLHEYTVAAKCTPSHFAHRLRREASIYKRLQPIQGIYVPVHPGNIDLQTHAILLRRNRRARAYDVSQLQRHADRPASNGREQDIPRGIGGAGSWGNLQATGAAQRSDASQYTVEQGD
ncbi:hypothetical protein BS50DRAFT_641285 [Corynespora cassiicola Philippines]|uniref:Uncharacterized protein n=1 Tax=Corynespora cassiicola Philippines TaxID=1448308 RepID=A0A2T2N0T4_CORCC|nr:hypothetical protein BS50DRAFT_641285 [Corynespora cassiicola Philippines]